MDAGHPQNRRRSILDLAPLELECMSVLWTEPEATVREIQARVSEKRPRAYTTILTIMDRLARKGLVSRELRGRAWVYRALFTVAEARKRAVAQVVTHFFSGSTDELRRYLEAGGEFPPVSPLVRPAAIVQAGGTRKRGSRPAGEVAAVAKSGDGEERIDTSLL